MSRRHDHRRFHRFYRLIANDRICVYCGVRATTVDHFVPLSVVAALADALDVIEGKFLVPACGECNSLAGAAVFKTIGAKRRFIQAKLRKRYRSVIEMPAWQDHELAEIGYALRTFIETGEVQRRWMIERLTWRNTSNKESVRLAEIRFRSRGSGNASVPSPAKTSFTEKSEPPPLGFIGTPENKAPCWICGEAFVVDGSRGFYCSDPCLGEGWRRMYRRKG